ncbi:MAG: NAD(P)H-dependent flavin oxidoreductase [Candidatus Competibacterales bacterium]
MNWPSTPLTDRLGLRYPIVQAPMAEGIATPELVAAVSEAGGLGCLGAGDMEPEAIRSAINTIRRLTRRPFAVNLFIPEAAPPEAIDQPFPTARLDPVRRTLDLPPSPAVDTTRPDYIEQLAVLLEEQVAVFSFSYGVPQADELEAVKELGIVTMGTATHLLEAILLEETGIDLIVAQGLEAGGPRGTFLGQASQGMVGTIALVPLLVHYLKTPVIASGGLMDGAGINAALALGAAGACLGTAFIATPESGAHPSHKALLAEGQGTEINTVITRTFSGRAARVINNRFVAALADDELSLAPYPLQDALTRDIRRAAADRGDTEYMALWAGQGCALCHAEPTRALMARWIAEVDSRWSKTPGY